MGSSAAASAGLVGGGRGPLLRLRKKKIVVGSLLLVAMLLTGLPVLNMLVSWPGGSCCKGKGQEQQEQKEAREWLPPATRTATLTTQQQLGVGAGGALRWRHQFSSYEEYVELQMKKTGDAKLRRLWTSRDWRRKVGVFWGVFQRLVRANLLHPGPKAKGLCIGARVGQEVVALRENGVEDVIGIDLIPAPPLVIKGDMHHHPFPNDTFDVEFSNVFDHALFPALFVSEIQRTLKPGGIAVLHLLLKARGDKYSTNDLVSLDPLLPLFQKCELEVVEVRDIDVFGLDTELVLRKKVKDGNGGGGGGICRPPKVAAHTISQAEPLITEEPRKPWITLKQNVKKIRYLPNLIDIGDDRSSYVYVDVGSRNYASSIGSWFNKAYPKQGYNFSIFAVEADPSFHAGYAKRRGVTLLPYAAWSRNETLTFGAASSNSQDKNVGEGGMGRIILDDPEDSSSSSTGSNKIVKVQGFDFAAWLTATVKATDYVVMKMDVEGTEFDLISRLLDTGAICLVDELFLECHYNRWQKCCPERTSKYTHTYADCLALFHSLRSAGLLVHQWW